MAYLPFEKYNTKKKLKNGLLAISKEELEKKLQKNILLAIWVKEQTECAVKNLQACRGCWKNAMFANLIEQQGHFYQ